MLTLLFIGILSLTFDIQQVEAGGTITIKADGSVEGTTYIVSDDNVTYTFTADITDSIVVQRSNITIDGKGHTLQGPSWLGEGFNLAMMNNVTIRNTNIKGFNVGININFASHHNTISGNNITTNGFIGIQVGLWEMDDPTNNNIISGNNITATDYYGIYIGPSTSHNTISGNNITEPREGLDPIPRGIFLGENSGNNIISGNNIVGLCLKGICGEGSSYNTISGNTITNNVIWGSPYDPFNTLDGIYLVSSSYNTISGNNITANDYGIWISTGSHYNTISGNNVTKNVYGILSNPHEISGGPSNNNIISGNNITANYWSGIMLRDGSSNNTISGNNIRTSFTGIHLQGSNNSIVGNNITNCGSGGGIRLESSSNTFYHNNFIENVAQVWASYGSANVWDDGYPSGGNYWSDYNRTDSYSGQYQNETGSDGIGDTSYTIDVNNQDNYPLMGMFSDFVVTLECHVQTICNSSISDFQFNGTAICFNVTGETDTTGFCRICIPRALMNETYQVFVNGTEVPCNLLPCSNSTHCYLYFSYNLSTQEVIIIPEFPSFLVLPLFMTATLIAVIIYRRKYARRD